MFLIVSNLLYLNNFNYIYTKIFKKNLKYLFSLSENDGEVLVERIGFVHS